MEVRVTEKHRAILQRADYALLRSVVCTNTNHVDGDDDDDDDDQENDGNDNGQREYTETKKQISKEDASSSWSSS